MNFLVYKDGKPADNLELSGAYLFDPERLPLRASKDIRFESGTVYVGDTGTISAGFALPWVVDGIGKIMLPTTKLNIRPEPYLLNLELARARLMEITVKSEDWAVFDEDKSNTQKAISKAKALFTEAMCCQDEPAKACVLADKCLQISVAASESLAQKQTSAVISSKKTGGELNRYTLGCVYQSRLAAKGSYIQRLLEDFSYITIPVCWRDIEYKRGEYDYSALDEALSKFEGKKIFISVGGLVRFREEFLPDWITGCDFETVQEQVYGFICDIVKKYAGKVHQWNLISSVNSDNCLNFSFDECIEITRTACVAAKSTETKSLKMVEVAYPWSCYHIDNPFTISAAMYADLLISNAIIFDCLGININNGGGNGDMYVRDLMQISSMLDRMCTTSKLVHISGLSAPSGGDDAFGYWRNSWSQDSQAAWLEALYKIFLGKRQIGTITYSTLADSEDCYTGLYDTDFNPKAASKTIKKFNRFILH